MINEAKELLNTATVNQTVKETLAATIEKSGVQKLNSIITYLKQKPNQ